MTASTIQGLVERMNTLTPDAPLDAEDGFDDDVGVGQLVPVVGKRDRLPALPRLFLREPALLHLIHEHAHDRLPRACRRLRRSASITATGMPACANAIAIPLPIVPAPTTPAFAHLARLGRRQTRNLIQLAFGEKDVAQRGRLGRTSQFFE